MVFGLGGGAGAPAAGSPGQNSPQVQAAEAELEMATDTFNKIVASCHNKCVSSRYAEPDLNKGESVCIDRCVAKFFLVNTLVGERMQAIGGAAGQSGSSSSGSFF